MKDHIKTHPCQHEDYLQEGSVFWCRQCGALQQLARTSEKKGPYARTRWMRPQHSGNDFEHLHTHDPR